MVHRRYVQSNEEQMGMARNLATIKASSASVDTNPVAGLCLAATSGNVLRRPGEKYDEFNTLEKGKSGDRRQGAVGIAEHFRQCSDSGMVEPEMQKIRGTDFAKIFVA